MAAMSPSTMTQTWVQSNILVRCCEDLDLSKHSGAVRDYFQDNSRSGGGRLMGDGIKEVNPREFIVSFLSNESAGSVLRRSQHVLNVNKEEYKLNVGQCPCGLVAKHLVGATVMTDGDGQSYVLVDPSNGQETVEKNNGGSPSRNTGASSDSSSDFALIAVQGSTKLYQESDRDSPMDTQYDQSPCLRRMDSPQHNNHFVVDNDANASGGSKDQRGEITMDESLNKHTSSRDHHGQKNDNLAAVHAGGSQPNKAMTKTEKKKMKKKLKMDEAAQLSQREGRDGPKKKLSTDQEMIQDETRSSEQNRTPEGSKSSIASDMSSTQPPSMSRSLMSSLTSLSSDQIIRTVCIPGIPVEDFDFVELCLENRRNGGGDIETLKYDEEQRCAIVTFVESEVAKTMLDRGTVLVNKKIVVIAPIPTEPFIDTPSDDNKQAVKEEPMQLPVPSSSVQVMNMNEKLNRDVLLMYFENSKRSGGGVVMDVSVIEDQHRAVITFQDPAVVLSVLKRAHQLLGNTLEVLPLDLPPFAGPSQHCVTGSGAEFSCAIKVTGLLLDMSKEMIQLFFENRRRTGGGELVDLTLKLEEGWAVVTFENHHVVERVISQHRSEPLKLNDSRLDIKVMEPAPQPPLVSGDINPALLLVRHLPEEATSRDLKLFFHSALRVAVEKVTYSLQPGIALLEFLPDNLYDFDTARRLVFMRPFFGVMLSVERVVMPYAVQIYNIAGLSEELITLYLENPRTHAGEVASVKLDEEEGYVVVTFENRSVIETLMSREHTLCANALNIAVYHACLGHIPPSLDSSEPMFRIPSDITLSFNANVVKFILALNSMKDDIEGRLAKKFCHIQWPSGGGSSITLTCKLTRTTPKAYLQARTWAKICTQTMTDLVNRVVCEKVDVLQDFWISLVEKLDAEIINQKGSLEVTLDKINHGIGIVGVKADCSQFVEFINKEVHEIEHQMEEQKKVVFEKNETLKVHQIKLLQAINFFPALQSDQASSSSTGTSDVQISFENGRPVFTGMPSSVMAKKIEMLEKVNMIVSEQFEPESYVSKLLKLPEFSGHLESTLKSKSIQIVWDMGSKGVVVYGFSHDDIDRGMSTIKSEFVERKIELDEPDRLTFDRPEWKEKKSALLNEISTLLIEENFDALTVTCTHSEIDGPLEHIGNFIKEYAVRKKFVQVPRGSSKIITTYMAEDLRKISDDFKSCSVRIEPAESGYTVSGTFHGLKHAIDKLNKLVESVFVKPYDLSMPGMSQHFNSARGKKNIETIQSRYQAIVEEFSERDEEEAYRDQSFGSSASLNGEFHIRAWLQVKGSFLVKVVQGDIVSYKTDVIVNAANDELRHIGGVARSISEAGGSSIQDECTDFIRSNKKLRVSEFYVSKPGKLPCKAVIHAVGPIWQSGNSNEENLLFRTISNILQEAEDKRYTSIALPAISTGIYGFPLNKATQVILEAIKDFIDTEDPSSLAEVVVIDTNTNVTDQFCETLGAVFRDSDVKFDKSSVRRKSDNPDWRKKSDGSKKNRKSLDTRDSERYSLLDVETLPSTSRSSAPTNIFKTAGGLTITLVKGSIVDEQADVIVNTTAQNLALKQGAVSHALLKVAGQALQAECLQKKPQGLTIPGEIAVTSAYNLSCKEVYHGYCLQWDNAAGPCEQSVRSLVKSVLTQACASGHNSIAIPAIGTGNLKVPNTLVAKWMFDDVVEFSKKNASSALKFVRFVVYSGDQPTVNAFQAEIQSRTGSHSQPTQPRVLAKSSGDEYQSLSSTSSAGSKLKAKGGGWNIDIGNIKVEVCQGDITREKVDAIVNSTNETLDLTRGAVSIAIGEAAGKAVLDECNDPKYQKRAKKHGLAVTSAGKLPCKHIFHLVSVSSGKGMKKGIESCLTEAEDMGLTSIVFPLLGTGTVGGSVSDMASTMLDAITNFSTKSTGPKSLSLVRITIFQPRMVGEFSIALEKKVKEIESPSTYKLIKNKVTSFLGYEHKNVDFKVSELPEERHFQYDERMRFRIFALSADKIEKVIKELEDLCHEVITDKVFEGGVYEEKIEMLSDEQVERIQDLEKLFPVKITIEKDSRIKRIRIRGEKESVSTVQENIHEVFHELDKLERQKFEDKILVKQAQWMFETTNGYENYPDDINARIERAFSNGQPIAQWNEKDKGAMNINFASLEEFHSGSSVVIKVKRSSSDSPLPKSWTPLGANQDFCKVLLSPTSQEYLDVHMNAMATCGTSLNNVVTIERIQNPSLYQQYIVKKNQLEKSQAVGVQTERTLWHGTSLDTLESINVTGFNRSYCGKNAVVFGRGVYFAQSFAYSAGNTYAVPDANGRKYVYQTRVLTGEFVVGNQTFIVPPQKVGATSTAQRYDSVVDRVANPSIFVIFNDTQAYPEYLITFT